MFQNTEDLELTKQQTKSIIDIEKNYTQYSDLVTKNWNNDAKRVLVVERTYYPHELDNGALT